LPRTTPLAVVEIDGRRWIVGTYGDVQWTRNLRAAGEATVRVGSREERLQARELSQEEAAAWFREQLVPYSERLSPVFRFFTKLLVRTAAPDILDDPPAAAGRRPVFELTRATP
jgi:deazaflavin-dependent oxidoreductase (nitroreductase family)